MEYKLLHGSTEHKAAQLSDLVFRDFIHESGEFYAIYTDCGLKKLSRQYNAMVERLTLAESESKILHFGL